MNRPTVLAIVVCCVALIVLLAIYALFFSKNNTDPLVSLKPNLASVQESNNDPSLFQSFPDKKLNTEYNQVTLLSVASEKEAGKRATLLITQNTFLQNSPRLSLFVFFTDSNEGLLLTQPSELSTLSRALEEYMGDKQVVVLLIESTKYKVGDLAKYINASNKILTSVLSAHTIETLAIAAHGKQTCSPINPFIDIDSKHHPYPIALIAYDGCIGDILTPEILSPASGTTIYLSPDISATGLGGLDPKDIDGSETRFDLMKRLWRITKLSIEAQPLCATKTNSPIQVFAPAKNPQRTGEGQLFSFVTNVGHANNVRVMTDIAFCALYANNR